MPLPIRLDGLSAKDEGGSYGVDAAPGPTTDAIRVAGRLWAPGLRPAYAFPNRRTDAASGTMLEIAPGAARGRHAALEVVWEVGGVAGPYSASVFPQAHPLIIGCGWAGTFSAAPTPQWTYAITGASRPSCTIYAYALGMLWKLVGCRGRLRLTFRPGQLALARFQMMGIVAADPTDVALPGNFAYTAVVPPTSIVTALAVGPYAPDWLSAEIDGGNPIERLDSGNAADGIQSFDFGVAQPTLTLLGKVVPLGTYSPFVADMKAAQGRAFTLTHGSVQYNKVTPSDALAYVADAGHEDQNRFGGYRLQYLLTAPQLLFN